ncbi:hypothetical protein [uncultured Jatrophihabitans sp.]|uniref:hypothetical protein n=1 Tax=uncultured Jatrophihabitans sp. TaxID=1610747 RepID=UPI0035CB1294
MDLSPELLAQLYTAAPDDFLSVRRSLADDAKAAGDTELAKTIAAQRKPTLGAWVVNRQVHAEPEGVERLVDLGARLRDAHEQLDATVLRELSTERRQAVAELTSAALARSERDDAPAALRDDVTGTFDAAVADPQIAARLGRLTRPERWSGFGVAMDAPAGTPELTVIRGGRDRAAARPPARRPKDEPRPDPAARRRARRAHDKAQAAFDEAEADLRASEDAERTARERFTELTAELARVEAELEQAKHDRERTRREVKSAHKRHREARSALDRADRQNSR